MELSTIEGKAVEERTAHFTAHAPEPLAREIRRLATANERSFSAEVRLALRQHVQASAASDAEAGR